MSSWFAPRSQKPFHNALVGAASKCHHGSPLGRKNLSIMPLWGLLRNTAGLTVNVSNTPFMRPYRADVPSHWGGNGKDTPAPKRHSQSGSCAAHPEVSHSVKLPKGVKQSEKRASPSDTSQRIIARGSLAHREANSKPKTRRGGFSMYGVGQKGGKKPQKRLASGSGVG